jgi:hypothetical protein
MNQDPKVLMTAHTTHVQLLERLDQANLDVIKNLKKTQKTARIGTL